MARGSDGTATFSIDLEDGFSGSAEHAAQSAEELRAKVLEGTAALRQMQAAMKSMQQGVAVDAAAFRALRDQISAQKARVAALNTEYVKMGGTFERLKKPQDDVSLGMNGIAQAANGLPGPLGSVAQSATGLSEVLGSAGVAGAALLAVAAMVAIAAATVGVIAKLTKFAVVSADAARSQLLLWQAALQGGPGAKAIGAAVDAVRGSVALSRTELAGMATDLTKAGLRGDDLAKSLEALGIAQAVGLDTGPIREQILEAKKLGQSVESVTAKIKAQYGGIAQKQMLSLGAQSQKLQDDIGAIFEGVDIEPFLKSLKDLLSIFDKNTASGKALKQLATSLLTPLIKGIAEAGPSIKLFFQGMLIGALKAAIVILTVRNKLRELTEGIDLGKHEKYFKALGIAAAVAAVGIGLVAIGITAIVGAVALMTGIALAGIGLVGAAFIALAFAPFLLAAAVGKAIVAAGSALKQLGKDALTAGQNFVSGLVDGITSGIGRVAAAAKSLAGAAVKATDVKLDARSPSRVMMKRGAWTAEGFALGMGEGETDVKESARALVSIPVDAAGGASGSAAGTGTAAVRALAGGGGAGAAQGRTTVTYNVVIRGVENAEQLTDEGMAAKLAATLERVVSIAGLEPNGVT